MPPLETLLTAVATLAPELNVVVHDELVVTGAVATEVALVDPVAFVAVTTARIDWPTSPAASRSVLDVAPPIAAQLLPEESQSCQL